MVDINILFAGTIIVGIIADAFALYAIKHAPSTTKALTAYVAMALVLISVGFSLHTAGDFFGVMFDNEQIEDAMESFAHVLLSFTFLVLFLSSRDLFKLSKEYGFMGK